MTDQDIIFLLQHGHKKTLATDFDDQNNNLARKTCFQNKMQGNKICRYIFSKFIEEEGNIRKIIGTNFYNF